MATAKKLPSGSWSVRVLIGKDENGKKKYKRFTGSDKRKVEREAAAYADEHRQYKKPETQTFGYAIDKFFTAKEGTLSPTTLDGHKRYNKNYLQPLQDIPLDKITDELLQDFIDSLAKEYSPKTVSNIYGLISTVLHFTRPKSHYHVTLPKKQKFTVNLPEPSDLFNAVKGKDIELAALLAMWLSLRMSEVRGIRKSDISSAGVLTINNVKVQTSEGDILKSETKTYESKRQLKVPDYIMNLINRTDTEFVVPYSVSVIEKRFAAALKEANLPHIRFHDLRKVNASVMLRLGIPDKYAMERGGWSSPDVMKRIYQLTFDSGRIETDDKIDRFFYSILHPDDTKDDTKN